MRQLGVWLLYVCIDVGFFFGVGWWGGFSGDYYLNVWDSGTGTV